MKKGLTTKEYEDIIEYYNILLQDVADIGVKYMNQTSLYEDKLQDRDNEIDELYKRINEEVDETYKYKIYTICSLIMNVALLISLFVVLI